MTGKRFEVHHMIRDYSTTEDVDFDFLQKLINEHRQPKDLTMHITDCGKDMTYRECEYLLNKYHEENKELIKENEELKEELKRCRNWINSDKNDYELTLSFIKNKGYSLKDVLEYEKELKE